MDKTITLLMGIHCHQPVGNFNWVFEEAYEKSYKPFLDVLEGHPKVKLSLHYSGCLLDWILENKPEFMDRLKNLVKSGQVEMMSGGYYEPILPIIPQRDALGQIKYLTDFLKKKTTYSAKGLWLTERVWEKELAKLLNKAGINYIIVDDYHFELAGIDTNSLSGYYTVVDGKFKINLFPSSKKLRYIMPFSKAFEVIDYLRSKATHEGDVALTFGDDGEKFGLWPHTYDWVYKQNWLDNFFTLLEENSSWIKVKTFSEYIKETGPTGMVDIPPASYPEMLEWSNGNFKNFFKKYPESSDMRSRMVYLSDKIEALSKKKGIAQDSLKILDNARKEMYKGQCNCPYWHGVFGGLYLGYLRSAIYEKLINAQKLLDRVEYKEKNWVSDTQVDINNDGNKEIILSNSKFSILIDPSKGGSVYEIDVKDRALNILNTLSRRPEAYHAKIKASKQGVKPAGSNGDAPKTIHDEIRLKDEGLDQILFYDKYRKASFVEHFLGKEDFIDNFERADLKEMGDFIEKPYSFRIDSKKDEKRVTLSRRSGMDTSTGKGEIEVKKTIILKGNSNEIEVEYGIKNLGEHFISSRFGVESNLFLKDKKFANIKELENAKSLDIADEWTGVRVNYKFDKAADIWAFELETVSDSESGMERTYQELSLMFLWNVELDPKEEFKFKITEVIK